jgi:hypothetical protein
VPSCYPHIVGLKVPHADILYGFLATHTIAPTCVVDCRCGGSNVASWEQCGLCSLPYPRVNLPGRSDLIDVLDRCGAFE